MAVVAEYKFKNAIVRIRDDYIETDPKERELILARAWAIIDNARLRCGRGRSQACGGCGKRFDGIGKGRRKAWRQAS